MCGHGLPRQGNFDIRVQIAPSENVEGWTANAMLPEALGQKRIDCFIQPRVNPEPDAVAQNNSAYAAAPCYNKINVSLIFQILEYASRSSGRQSGRHRRVAIHKAITVEAHLFFVLRDDFSE